MGEWKQEGAKMNDFKECNHMNWETKGLGLTLIQIWRKINRLWSKYNT